MANKRDLKKFVSHNCGMVAGECVLAMEYIDGVDLEKMGQALLGVADLQLASLKLISFSYDKSPRDFDTPHAYHKARRDYYKKAYSTFVHDFMTHLQEIVAKMNEAMPEQARKEMKNKAAK